MRILIVLGALISILTPGTGIAGGVAGGVAASAVMGDGAEGKGPPDPGDPHNQQGTKTPQTANQPTVKAGQVEAGNDRLILSPTTQTLPEGVNAFSDYELLLLQYRYGITDQLEFSLMFTPPIVQISAYPSLKWRVLDTEHVKLALEIHAGETFFYLFYPATGFIAGGSIVADFCLDIRCGAAITLSAQPDYMAMFSGGGEGTMGMRASAGARFDITKTIKGILEMTYAGLPILEDGVLLLNYGIRIHAGQFAGDIGFVRPLFINDRHGVYGIPKNYWAYVPLGIPWLGLTYQW